MSRTVTVEEAERDLRHILESLSPGDRITVVDETGVPLGEVTGTANSPSRSREEREAVMDQWNELAQQIGEAWDDEKSAVEQLQEDRSRLDPAHRNWVNDP